MKSSGNSSLWTTLENCLTTERLDAYRADGVDAHLAISRYLFNTAVSEALYPVLQFAEISLRNAMHQALSVRFATDHWYDLPQASLTLWQQSKIAEAKRLLQSRGKPQGAGRVVAELSFGFWTSFFNRVHARSGIGHYLARQIFSHAPATERSMSKQDAYWSSVRELRNRVFHHERIIHWRDLDQQHQNILTLLGWIDPGLNLIVSSLDRFQFVRGQGIGYWMATSLDVCKS